MEGRSLGTECWGLDTMNAGFVGLYYPYSRCLNELAIKKALLIFDEICFVDPVERLVREYLSEKRFPAIRKISELYAELESVRVARRVFPFPQIRDCDKLLWDAAATDEQDQEFRKLVEREATADVWEILKNKYSGAAVVHLTSDPRAAMGYGMRGGMSEEEAKAHGFYATGQDFSSQYIMRTAHEYVHPAIGLSLGINHTLVLCESSDFLPFTDSLLAHEALMLKYRRAAANPAAPLERPRSSEIDEKFVSLSFSVLSALLDEQELARRSIREILKFRKESTEQLLRFRERLRSLAADIQAHPWEAVFRQHIVQRIEATIVTELRAVEDTIVEMYEKMFGNLLKKTATLMTPTLLGTVLAGLSPGQILAFSTAAVTGALGMTIPEFVDIWLAKRKLRRNGLAFLIAARQLGRAN